MSVITKPFFNQKAPRPMRSQRNRVLSQWRGIDVEPDEVARKVRGTKPSDVLPNLLGKYRIEKRQSDAEILKVWNEMLDPKFAAHAKPTGLNKGTLFVTVDSSVWLDELVRYQRREILKRLQYSFGSDLIARISFRLG